MSKDVRQGRDGNALNPAPITFVALASGAWVGIAIVIASLSPGGLVPHVFYSYHIEHLAAFYVLAFLAAAALPALSVLRIAGLLGILALILAALRLNTASHRLSALEDLACDFAGVGAALSPIFVAELRHAWRAKQSARSNES